MENNERCLRKRKLSEKDLDLDKDFKKQCNVRQQKSRHQEQSKIKQFPFENNTDDTVNTKPSGKDGLTKDNFDHVQSDNLQMEVTDLPYVSKGKQQQTGNRRNKIPNKMPSTSQVTERDIKGRNTYLKDGVAQKSLKREKDDLKESSARKKDTAVIKDDMKDLQNLKNKNVQLQKDLKTLQGENRKLVVEIKRSERSTEKWKETATAEKKENKRLRQEKATLEKNIKDEKRISKKLKDDIKSLESAPKLKEFSKNATRIKHEAPETENKKENKIDKSKQLMAEKQNCKLNTEKDLLLHEDLEREILNLKEGNQHKDRQIETLNRQFRDISCENEILKNKLIQNEKDKEIETAKMVREVEVLKHDKMILQNQSTDLNRKIQNLEEKMTTESKTHEEKVLDLICQLKFLQESKSKTEITLNSLMHDYKELQQMYETTKQKLDQFISIKKVNIQLFHGSTIPLISKVVSELMVLLKNKMENDLTKLEFNEIQCKSDHDIDPDKTLLIVCINASRLGTDALNAIKTLHVTSKMALLVFHHKDGHALPSLPSEHVLTGQEFKHLGGIFDFGFLIGKGIYSCEMNDQSLKYLMNFLNRG